MNKLVRTIVTDPWWNLATEDWLFRRVSPGDVKCFLWQNAPSIVIGRAQNPWREVHMAAALADGIPICRRQSGGGAVYQGLGNLNFTLMGPRDRFSKADNCRLIVDALAAEGMVITVNDRYDLCLDGAKISGSAFRETKDWCFHHGTLLVESATTEIGRYLARNEVNGGDAVPAAYTIANPKGVVSQPSRVSHLTACYDTDVSQVADAIGSAFCATFGSVTYWDLGLGDVDCVSAVRTEYEKLRSWDWTYGKTLPFELVLADDRVVPIQRGCFEPISPEVDRTLIAHGFSVNLQKQL